MCNKLNSKKDKIGIFRFYKGEGIKVRVVSIFCGSIFFNIMPKKNNHT